MKFGFGQTPPKLEPEPDHLSALLPTLVAVLVCWLLPCILYQLTKPKKKDGGDVILTTPSGKVIRASTDGLASINALLHPQRVGVTPLPLAGHPRDLVEAIRSRKPLSASQKDAIVAHFTPTRERYLEIIRTTGFEPHVEGGGSLEVQTQEGPGGMALKYPNLSEVPIGTGALTGFFGLHLNYEPTPFDADPVVLKPSQQINEIFTVLSGSPKWWQTSKAEGVCKIEVQAGPERAWIMHYSGSSPHAGLYPPVTEMPIRVLACAIGPRTYRTIYKHPRIPDSPWVLDDAQQDGVIKN